MITHFQQFNVVSLSFDTFKVRNETVVKLKSGSDDCPLLQLPWIEMTSYGIPKKSKYFPCDKDRMFIQIPVEGELLQKFKELDEHLASLSSSLNNASYSPLVKEGYRGEYIKVKLSTDHETGEIVTPITICEETICPEILPEFEKYFQHNCKIKAILKISNVWRLNKKYGITLKLYRVMVEEPKPKSINTVDFID
jgi:hypothetical protein